MSLVVKPLSQALGAEIVGVDLSKDLSAQTVSDILDAWHQYLVILFRDQSLTEDEQFVSPSISAPCKSAAGHRKPGVKRRSSSILN